MGFGDALEEIADSLRQAGLRATTDPVKIQLPGVLVMPGTMRFNHLDGSFEAVIEIYLLTANKGTSASLNDLQDLLNKLRSVYSIPSAEPISVPLKNLSPDPVPGLLVNLQTVIS